MDMQELREKSKKDYYSDGARRLHYALLYITRFIIKTGLTPNQITFFWLFLQVIASVIMVGGTYWYFFTGMLLYTFAGLLDAIDGDVARIKGMQSAKGIFLEMLGVYTGSPLFFFGFGIGLTKFTGNTLFFFLGVLSGYMFFLSKLVAINPTHYPQKYRRNIEKMNRSLTLRNKRQKWGWLYFLTRRSNPFNLLFLGILFGFAPATMILYALLYCAEFARRLLKAMRTISQVSGA